jgi:hypothetical protein
MITWHIGKSRGHGGSASGTHAGYAASPPPVDASVGDVEPDSYVVVESGAASVVVSSGGAPVDVSPVIAVVVVVVVVVVVIATVVVASVDVSVPVPASALPSISGPQATSAQATTVVNKPNLVMMPMLPARRTHGSRVNADAMRSHCAAGSPMPAATTAHVATTPETSSAIARAFAMSSSK